MRSLLRQNVIASLFLLISVLLAGCPPTDVDEDGFTVEDGDCDDNDATVYPGATELLCDGIDQDCLFGDLRDADQDGVSGCDGADPFDCDDTDATSFPGNTELCDAVDHDCDGDIANGLDSREWWLDLDEDSYGAGDREVTCDDESPAEGYVSADDAQEDCDDDDPTINPDAEEVCDAVDNNCDSETDEGFDADEDGVTTCGADGQEGNLDDDCDDGDGSNFPGNAETCDAVDNDCDTVIDNGFDVDLDGVTSCGPDGAEGNADDDCDDANPDNFPGNTEVCDAVDNNCDGTVDDGFDVDSDGVTTCGPNGTVGDLDDDCDDGDTANFPGNPELCDGSDNDCDTFVDNGFDLDLDGVTSCGADGVTGNADDDCDDGDIANFPGNIELCDAADNDCDTLVDNGFDVDTDGVTSCGPDGITGNADDDCDDGDIDNFPGNAEVCDGLDNNCDSTVDDGLDGDADSVTPCGPDGITGNADDDCDDGDSDTFPGATEICDAIDNDCDGTVPANETDSDLDQYIPCTLAPGASPLGLLGGGDCDDGAISVNPGATELCDGADTDCAGGVPGAELDEDGDLYLACSGFSDLGLGFNGGDDCDDSVAAGAARNPGLAEVCDLLDNNCDLTVDEGFDGDGDGVYTCGPDGIIGNGDDDCLDSDITVFPGASEICDNVDNDCDTLVDGADPGFVGADGDADGDPSVTCGGSDCDDTDASLNGLDRDFDGETSCAGDCDDTDPTFRTTTVEACDGEDNDCNGLVDDGVGPDADGDGFDTSGCGFFGSDCMDTDAHVFPSEEYGSGYQKQCMPAVRPGFGTSWAYGRLNLPSYFEDPQTGTSYLYFRANHDPTFHQFGFVSSANGVNWGDIEGPIFGEDPALGAWDGRKISHPSVAFVPGKARPYIMVYHALDDSSSTRRIGVATAETAEGDFADGTFKRQSMSGASLSSWVLDVSTSTTAVDSERVLNPSIWFDTATGLLHMWYTGRFGSPNAFAIAHASCDTAATDCGTETDWVKTDSNSDGDPDIWLLGTSPWSLNGSGVSDVQQTFVMSHSDSGGFLGYELEVFYTGAGTSVGSLQGDIADSTSWTDSPANPVLQPDSASDRFDGQSTTGRGVRYDSSTFEYHMYYGTSVVLPEDPVTGEGTDPLWGPRNYSSGASYIGHAINAEPTVTIGASSCSALSGDIADHGPDTVGLTVYDGSVEIVSEFFGTPTGTTTDFSLLSTPWSASFSLSAGSHTLTVVAEDQGGAERSESVVLVCP